MQSPSSDTIKGFHPYPDDGLTGREMDVLKLICQQLSTREIADMLHISKKTVETHRANLIVKTAVRNMAGLVIYAVQHNIVNAGEIVLDGK